MFTLLSVIEVIIVGNQILKSGVVCKVNHREVFVPVSTLPVYRASKIGKNTLPQGALTLVYRDQKRHY